MKRVKRYLIILVCIMLLNGCIKNDTTMKINKDKSMNLELSVLIKDEYKNQLSANFKSAEIEKNGFKVTTTTKGNYSGYKITKMFNSIDELSKGDNKPLEITNILDSNFDFTKLFSKKTTFFNETYTANYNYSITSLQKKYSLLDENNDLNDTGKSNSIENYNELSLTYTLVLPVKAKTNDASETSDGGKKLVWKLSPTTDSKINYSFVIYNYKHIAYVGLGALLLLIIIIIIIVIIKKKKSSSSSLIYKEYDPSIEGQLNKNEIIKDDSSTVFVQEDATNAPKMDSLEFQSPDENASNHIDVQTLNNQFVSNNPTPAEVVPQNDMVIPQVTQTPQVTPVQQVEVPTPQVNTTQQVEVPTPQVVPTIQEPLKEPEKMVTPAFIPTLAESQNTPQVLPEPAPLEPQNTQMNVSNYNATPDFVRRNDSHMFINDNQGSQSSSQVDNNQNFSTPELDIPNATALSDMPEYK